MAGTGIFAVFQLFDTKDLNVVKHSNSRRKEDEQCRKISEITFLKEEGKTFCGIFVISDMYWLWSINSKRHRYLICLDNCLFTPTVTRFLVKGASIDPWSKETRIVWPKFRGGFHSDTVFTLTSFFEVIKAYSEQKGVKKRHNMV